MLHAHVRAFTRSLLNVQKVFDFKGFAHDERRNLTRFARHFCSAIVGECLRANDLICFVFLLLKRCVVVLLATLEASALLSEMISRQF